MISSRPRGPAIAARLAFGLAVALLLATTRPVVSGDPDFAAEDDVVRTMMSESGVPGAAYGIVRDGRVVHLAAFGSAGPGRPMTAQTLLVIGSVGKSITALAIRQLVQTGAVDLDAPVRRYLPWFSLDTPAAAEQMTVRSLLDHTSGLSTALGQDPRWYTPGLSGEEIVRGLAKARADIAPATYAYSNLNYVVLGTVIEIVSGSSYADYVRTHIFEPLSMTRSSASLDGAGTLAQGHRYVFGIPVPFDEPYPTGMVAAGYQLSTAEDMATFAAALASGGVHDGVDLVGSRDGSIANEALSTDWQPLASGGAGAIVSQSGATLNSNADLTVVPSRRDGVVVMFNANPTQFLGLPAGAADAAMGVIALRGGGPATSAQSVRTVYLWIDAILLTLGAAFLVHAFRARTWRRRMTERGGHRLLVARTAGADFVLPLAVLIGLPLLIGSTGSSAAGDVVAGWRFVVWTLPDMASAILAITVGALGLGVVKVVSLHARPAGIPAAPPPGKAAPHAAGG